MFFSLLLKVFPLYITIFVGYVAGRYLNADRNTIANLLFFILSPIVVFFGISQIKLNLNIISLPIFVWFVCSIISLVVYYASSLIFRDNTRNILAFSSGSSSMGFFGLPVALALFDDSTISIYVICYIGMLFFENSFGFYIAAKGIYTAKECMIRLAKLPSAYAAIIALILNVSNVEIPEFLYGFLGNIRGSFMILGMMLLGISLANIKIFTIDWKFIITTIMVKYLLWPVIILGLILLDQTFIKFYTPNIYKTFILLAIIPVSGSGMILATVLNYQPDKIAIMLLINTIVGLFYVPFMISLFIY